MWLGGICMYMCVCIYIYNERERERERERWMDNWIDGLTDRQRYRLIDTHHILIYIHTHIYIYTHTHTNTHKHTFMSDVITMTIITVTITPSETGSMKTNVNNSNVMHIIMETGFRNQQYKFTTVQISSQTTSFAQQNRSKNDHQIRNVSLIAVTDPSYLCITEHRCSINTFDLTLKSWICLVISELSVSAEQVSCIV